MPCKHSWQQIARIEGADRSLSYEIERCVKCQSERCLRTEKYKVKLESFDGGPGVYLKAAATDINYTLINYGVKDLKATGISNPKALEEAMTAYMEAYNGRE
ncbi:MAG: hypothetical protein JRE40_10310 [Deltaproteobacteria bacterium]|nr:hypothetical protein [Deltaproteobacteria bacterium]MBW2673932.1 hypothetical protein [Deltaproteobacteria bacterium]